MPIRSASITVRLAALVLLVGCAKPQGITTMSPAQGELPIIGTLTYRARIALPADARAVVEVREGDGPDGPVVAERRIDLEGKQVPIVIDLRIDRARLAAGRRYYARGALLVGGRPAWATEPVALDVTQRSIELGTLEMLPVRVSAFASTLRCGEEHATVGWVGQDSAELTIGGELFTLRRARSGSGARYEAPGDSTTWLWNKGDRTTISVRGKTYPECGIVGADDETFRAHGNEPFWSLEITRTTLTFRTPEGQPITLPSSRPTLAAGSRRYAGQGGGHDLAATVTDRICTDDMSGMPYPSTVIVVLDGREYRGCGGEPAAVLQGKEWVVEDVNRAGIIDRSRLTLNFSADDRVFGRAGCNTYSGRFTLTGESLTVASPVTTLKACAESLMQQEDRFLKVLADVRRFEITPTGALVLHADDGRSITARR